MSAALLPSVEAHEAAARLADLVPGREHRVALVLGSGWAPVAENLADPGSAVSRPLAELPGFVAPTAAGHGHTATSCTVDGVGALVFAGRTHLYEGHPADRVTHSVAVAAALGVRAVVLTNACGGLRGDLSVGDLVLIADHLNLTGATPLSGPRFVDLTDAYDPDLRAAAGAAIGSALGSAPPEGVYAQLRGPQYETPAEIRMLRTLGADLVGMSTAVETIAARALGLRVVGVSLVTNLAAGVTGAPLDHAEVLAAGHEGSQRLTAALRATVPRLTDEPPR